MNARWVVVVALCGLVLPAAVGAGDFCLDSDGLPIVAQGFRMPRAGTCRTWKGAFTEDGEIVRGSGCTTSDASTLRIGYAIGPEAVPQKETGALDIPLPLLEGGTATYLDCGASGCTATVGAASAGPCDVPGAPVPLPPAAGRRRR